MCIFFEGIKFVVLLIIWVCQEKHEKLRAGSSISDVDFREDPTF